LTAHITDVLKVVSANQLREKYLAELDIEASHFRKRQKHSVTSLLAFSGLYQWAFSSSEKDNVEEQEVASNQLRG
jgi:hypothetical protein